MARAFLTLLQHWSVRSCVRPVCAACMAAGHNAFRGSGPNRKPALDGAMTHTGSPDPSIDLVCITSFALTNSFGRSACWYSSCRQRQHRLVVSLLSTQVSYATSMPQRRRRPQHHKRTANVRYVRIATLLPFNQLNEDDDHQYSYEDVHREGNSLPDDLSNSLWGLVSFVEIRYLITAHCYFRNLRWSHSEKMKMMANTGMSIGIQC